MLYAMPKSPPYQASPRAGSLQAHKDGYWTFVPTALPPTPDINQTPIAPLLSRANIAVGRLDGLSEFVPNVEWFVAMYVRREAVLSSQIEGTQSSLTDLLAFEQGESHDDQSRREDAGEVVNYVRALNAGIAAISDRRLDTTMLQALHLDLMEGTRGESQRRSASRSPPPTRWSVIS
jgi:Fic family protein